MGGCCCCSSKGPEINSRQTYYYYPRALEERVPLSPHHGPISGLLVDTNLDTSSPDTYRPPPTPMPYDVTAGHPQTPHAVQEIHNNKSDAGVQPTDSESMPETVGGITREASAKCEDIKESNKKIQGHVELESEKESTVELSKLIEPVVTVAEEEDVCPTCLEEYDLENPKIVTKCEHHFHLSCILEWLERSDTCPVCDKEMIFSSPID